MLERPHGESEKPQNQIRHARRANEGAAAGSPDSGQERLSQSTPLSPTSSKDLADIRAALDRALTRAYGRNRPRPYPSTTDIEELVHDVLQPGDRN